MPLYEYECEVCGTRFERIRKFSDPPVKECVACGGAVRKLLSLAAIQFKGSGWYITDYARKGQSTEAGDSKGDSKVEAKKVEAKKETGDSAARTVSSPASNSTSSSAPATSSTGSSSSDS